MNFGCKSLMAIVNRVLKVLFVVGALVFSTQACSSIGLQAAWSDFMVEAKPLLGRGVKPQRVLRQALTSFEQSPLSAGATDIFIELLDALLTKVSQTASFDGAESIKEFRTYLFDEMLSASPLLRQKLALEVFKEHKKWNVVMTETGLVGSVDTTVFMYFARSLPALMSDLTCEGKYLIPVENLEEFKKLGVDLSKKFKTNLAVVLAKETANYTAHGYKVVAQKVKAMDAGTVRKVVMTTGAVSATALLLGSCYFINNHRSILRNFVESLGGPEEVKKQAVFTYLNPASGAKRVKGLLLGGLQRKVQEWWYDDSDYRNGRFIALQTKIANFRKPASSTASNSSVAAGQDRLTQYLLSLAADPASIPQECALEVQTEMVRSLNYEKYHRKQIQRQSELQRALLEKSNKAKEALKASLSEYKEQLSPSFEKHPLRWVSNKWHGRPTGTPSIPTPVHMGMLVPPSPSGQGAVSLAPSAPAVRDPNDHQTWGAPIGQGYKYPSHLLQVTV